MGIYTCEVTGKCVTGVIAATGLDGLHNLLSVYEKAGERDVEMEITVRSPSEANSYSFQVSNLAELIEMLRLTTGR